VLHRLEDCKIKIVNLEARVDSAAAVASTPNQVASSPQPSGGTVFSATDDIPAKGITYPWKGRILTTVFWIGEGASQSSAWNQCWTCSNGGADDPGSRNGFGSATHASAVNPFYVALPFNDLAHPELANQYLPRPWPRRVANGKPLSACQNRWLAIKNSTGRICYAQWEDVGPSGGDKASYVFGPDLPNPPDSPGLDVSPAVAQYLQLEGNGKNITSWRFVDDQDVPPGQWLKYDEQAVIYSALHEVQKSSH
jgi:hypothetical protein